jgi:hypothetical protein
VIALTDNEHSLLIHGGEGHMKSRIASWTLSVALCALAGSGASAQEPRNSLYRTEEVTVQAGEFTIVGDLYIPLEGTKHPAVVWVHGSGGITRQLMVPLIKPQIEVFLRAGFAVFIDDIPGSGASKGQMQSVFQDRALILTREIEALKSRADIIPTQVGVAGASQAGVVMPLASSMTSDIAFMIAEACVAEASYKQDAYLVKHYMICEGLSPDEADKTARLQLQRYETDDYEEYLAAVEYLSKSDPCKLIGLNNPAMSEEKFRARDKSTTKLGARYDPMPLVALMKFPVLALFGEKDKNINSAQGVRAYRQAFKTTRNKLDRVELIANANHCLYEAETGCVRELMAQVSSCKPSYSPQALKVLTDWLVQLRARLDRAARASQPE